MVLLKRPANLDADWFLDGRRRKPVDPYEIPPDVRPTVAPMTVLPNGAAATGVNPGGIQHQPIGAPPAMLIPQPAPDDAWERAGRRHRTCYFCATLEYAPTDATDALRIKGRAALLSAKHWGAKRHLSVGFIGGSETVRQRVKRIAAEWSDRTGKTLKFDFWTAQEVDPSTADIRVSFVQDGRSWSFLGTDARNRAAQEATMNLGWLTETLSETRARAVILHEFGHALGLIHEHQNPILGGVKWNMPEVMRDLSGPPNNWDPDTIQHNMFMRYGPDDLFATDVDSTSIMMYPIPENWTLDDFSVGFNTDLSANDIALIKTAYPRI